MIHPLGALPQWAVACLPANERRAPKPIAATIVRNPVTGAFYVTIRGVSFGPGESGEACEAACREAGFFLRDDGPHRFWWTSDPSPSDR